MKKSLVAQVKDYIADHGRRRRLLALICVLSVATSLGVYGALMRPAISMEKSNPLLTAEVPNAVFGDVLAARITATAAADREETYFYLSAETENAALTDAVSFDGDGDTAAVPTLDGGTLTLHRDGEDGCWFALEKGRTVSFDLTYRSTQIESIREIPREVEPSPGGEADHAGLSAGPDEGSAPEEAETAGEDIPADAEPVDAEPAHAETKEAGPVEETPALPEETAPAAESAAAGATETVYADPDAASVRLCAAAGPSLAGARAAAEEKRDDDAGALTLSWMTQAALDAIPEVVPGEEPEETDKPPAIPVIPEMPEGATSWATVERSEVDEEPTAQSFGLSAAGRSLLAAEDSVDFGEYITSAEVSKLQNGKWVAASEFIDGDTVKVGLTYALPANTISASRKTITYQLPVGVVPGQRESGSVYEETSAVGTYDITPDGEITITFNDSFADSKPFQGTIQFQGKVSAAEDGESNTVRFGSVSTTIVISPVKDPTDPTDPPSQTDLIVQKTGSYSPSANKLSYIVTVSTTKGTASQVTIIDEVWDNDTQVRYDESSIKVYKNGTGSPLTGYTLQFTVNPWGENQPKFTISGLPQLSAGESYRVTYTVTPGPTKSANGASYVSNSASAKSGSDSAGGWAGTTLSGPVISKRGSYSESTGKITWTIEVHNPNGLDLGGYKLSDVLRMGGVQQTLPTPASVKNASTGAEVGTIGDWSNYTFPQGSKGAYTITYVTDAPAGVPGTSTVLDNQVSLTKDGGTDYSAGVGVTVPHRDYGVNKRASGVASEEGVYRWTVDLSAPLADLDVDHLIYTDTLKDATLNGTTVSNTHYTTAQRLGNLKIVTAKGQTLVRGTHYFITDLAGTVITGTGKSPIKGFIVKFNSTQVNAELVGGSLTVTYETVTDVSTAKEGESYVFSNTGSIPGKEPSTASYTYTAPVTPKTIEKQASVTGTIVSGKTTYTNDDLTADYDAVGGEMYYRLVLRMSDFAGDTITLTDTLPAGAALVVPASGTPAITAKLHGNDNWEIGEFNWGYNDPANNNNWVSGTYKFSDQLTYSIAPNESGITTLTVQIADVGKIRINNAGMSSPYVIVLYYKLSFVNDPVWSNLSNKSRTYTNRAAWNGGTTTQRTTINREVPNVGKTGAQLPETNADGSVKYDDKGQPILTNVVRYRILINPAGLDLATGADTIALRDVLSTQAGAGLLIDSVKLYRYDVSNPDGLGAAFSQGQYSFSYNDLTHTASFVLPDSTPSVLVYDYFFDRGSLAGDVAINNTATLQGNSMENGTSNIMLKESSSSATANKKTVTVYKVDSADYSKLLPGAAFELKQYNKASSRWDDVSGGAYTTGGDGKILLENMSENVLYRLTETAAPAGYVKSGTAYYFVWMADGKSREDTISAMTAAAFGGVSTSQVRFVSSSGAAIYVPNEYTAISVKKLWRDESGAEAAPAANSVELELWREPRKIDGYTARVTVKGSGEYSNPPIQQELVVSKGSALTINLAAWSVTYSISYNGQSANFSPVQGIASYTIPAVDNHLDVIITTSAYHPIAPTFSGYTNPTAMTAAGPSELVADMPILLNGANGWVWLNADLPKADASGNAYYYWVKEKVPSGSAVSYMNNSGITTGDITVTNTVSGSNFTLPSTGGMGLLPIRLFGASLMVAAASAALLLLKKRRSEGGRS
ncbi:MAG TPA: SpaA isopeptide-forming pilin-related protein [Pseudoflavonifractor sp.]|nr:SpaA isopeptide-forming pilin-related protein [Pseudoflavonifractor sp.]